MYNIIYKMKNFQMNDIVFNKVHFYRTRQKKGCCQCINRFME